MRDMHKRLAVALAIGAMIVMAQPVFESPQERGWAVLEETLKAAGGREKLAAIRDISFDVQSKLPVQTGVLDLASKIRVVLPDTVRQDMSTQAGESTIALDRWRGWRRAPGGQDEIPADQLQRTQAEMARTYWMFRPPADRSSLRWVGTETVEGRACDVIEIANVAGAPLRLFVDRQTRDVLKRTYRAIAPDGKPADVEEFLSDYRVVDGLRWPFKIRVTRNGNPARETITKNMKINTGLKAEDLMRVPEK